MDKMIRALLRAAAKVLLKLRYRVLVKGREELLSHRWKSATGFLFLANHPAELDPVILLTSAPSKFPLQPLVIDDVFDLPFVSWLIKKVEAFPIPNFDEGGNAYTRKLSEQSLLKIVQELKRKKSFLIYPAGKLKSSGLEEIGGASGLHLIMQEAEHVNVVLVRTTGLWGSSFSRASTGTTPPILHTLKEGAKLLLRNFLFFAPRRDVLVEFQPAPEDFPYKSSKSELNHYLEEWFNQPFEDKEKGEPLALVRPYFWSSKKPKKRKSQKIKEASFKSIPEQLKKETIEEIASLSKKDPNEITLDKHLSKDLGMDSLDLVELISFLHENAEITHLQPADLTTVASVFQGIAHPSTKEEGDRDEILSNWFASKRPQIHFADGKTLCEVFLNSCDRMGGAAACADDAAGVFSYRRFKMAVLLLADKLAKVKGEHIGILLPASVGAALLIFAALLAKKVPVMLNWTLGSNYLRKVAHQADLHCILSSFRFLKKAKQMDLDGVESLLLTLEDLKKKITLKEKIEAFLASKKSADQLIKKLGLSEISEENQAVLLFTSGTEGTPKGVPLTHRNILSNQRAAVQMVPFHPHDVFYGFLPPFHSFGFSVVGLLPFFLGCRVAYYPDPTDGASLAKKAAKWQASIICGAPTFLKNMLRMGKPECFKNVRLFVSGAEKAPESLFQQVGELKKAQLIEGYGITETSPILTLNLPDLPPKGVGKPLPGVELLIVDPQTHEPLAKGQEGLILVRGDNVFNGYWHSKHSAFVSVQGLRWYQTGDLGKLDEEGFLTLSGRLKRFVKVGGEMISLKGVEDFFNEKLAKKESSKSEEELPCAVIAKETEGERPKLILFSTVALTVKEANALLKSHGFSNLTKIGEVKEIEQIPLLATGKVNYPAIEKQLAE